MRSASLARPSWIFRTRPAFVVVGWGTRHALETEPWRALLDPRLHHPARQAVDAAVERDVLVNAQVGIQRYLLRDVADAGARRVGR